MERCNWPTTPSLARPFYSSTAKSRFWSLSDTLANQVARTSHFRVMRPA